jgi:Tfp pilus assembly protein PilW
MKRRPGFTITELLVAMALIMLIMAVMAEAFTESLKTFSAMKSIGDMDQKMRAAVVILSRDLSDDHFGNLQGNYTALSQIPNPVNSTTAAPGPNCGFFVISQSAASNNEGNDADTNPSPRNTTGLLHFTVNRAKNWNPIVNAHTNRRENYLAGLCPTTGPGAALSGLTVTRFSDSTNYYSQVGEVAYFLRDSGDTTPSGAHRFTLFRRQAVVLSDNDATAQAATVANASNFCDFSWGPPASLTNANRFNKFSDLPTVANRRLIPGGSYSANAPGCAGPIPIYAEDNTSCSGNDILLTDVLSFTIQVMRSDIIPYTFSDVTYFDTGVASTSWNPAVPTASAYNIRAIQIIIRVWDLKTQSARQITITQDTCNQ